MCLPWRAWDKRKKQETVRTFKTENANDKCRGNENAALMTRKCTSCARRSLRIILTAFSPGFISSASILTSLTYPPPSPRPLKLGIVYKCFCCV